VPDATARAAGVVDHGVLFYTHGNFRSGNLIAVQDLGFSHTVMTLPLAQTSLVPELHSSRLVTIPCDPNKFGSMIAGTQIRVVKAFMTIRCNAAPGTQGEMIIANATPRITGDAGTGTVRSRADAASTETGVGQATGISLRDIPGKLRVERHSTTRIPLVGPRGTGTWQRTWMMPLVRPENYGKFTAAHITDGGIDSIHDAFGGFFVVFEGVSYTSLMPPPTFHFSIALMLEEELDLSINDLACSTRTVSNTDGKCHGEKHGGLAGGKETSGSATDAHSAHPGCHPPSR